MTQKHNVKVFVVGGSVGYVNPLLKSDKFVVDLVRDWEEADILWFTGGEDVDPAIYKEPVHPATGYSVRRSYQEDQLIKLSKGTGKLLVGTCRGHQQFHASSGGILIQHTNRHAGSDHLVKDVRTGKVIGPVTSAHHQAVLATEGVAMEILLTTPEIVATTQQIGADNDKGFVEVPIEQEIEAAFWPSINALGIQGHPEWMYKDDPVVEWFVDEIETRWLTTLAQRNENKQAA